MPTDDDAEQQRKVLRAVARALEVVHELIPQPMNQRPAFPAINAPTAGSVINASQTAPTALPVSVSSNRNDLIHYVDLLDADTLAVIDGPATVAFAGNTGTASITIPTQAGPGPTTHLLQCRCPTSVAGNTHRIFIDVQAPALPTAPTITLGAMAGGAPLPSGSYPNATPGLDAVIFTASTTGGTAPFTYNWSIARMTSLPVSTVTVGNTNTYDLIPGGTVFPTSVVVSCYVTDSHGLNSPPVFLNYFIS